MKSALTIAFDFAPSRATGAVALLVCLCATLAPWASALPLALCVTLSLGAGALGLHALWRYWHPPFRRIALRESGWVLLDHADVEQDAVLHSHAHLGVLLTLGFRYGPRAYFRAVLAPDNLDADTRRRLILLLSRAEIVHAA